MSKKGKKLTKEQYKNLCFWAPKISMEILGKGAEIEDLKIAGKSISKINKELSDIKAAYDIAVEKIKEYEADNGRMD